MYSLKRGFLKEIYARLYKEFGPQYWWPGETKIEIIIGAILTQNTNWINVEKALSNLKNFSCLSVESLNKVTQKKLAELIKPAGYFNVKAKRIKCFIEFLFAEFAGDLNKMAKLPLPILRARLLSVHGIGPETADAILLYAFNKPIFVVDAYTKRLLYRHNMVGPKAGYHTVQDVFMRTLTHDTIMFNEFHALIVRLGKQYCRTKPQCAECPLNTVQYSLDQRCAVCFRFLPEGKGQKKKLSKQVIKSNEYTCARC